MTVNYGKQEQNAMDEMIIVMLLFFSIDILGFTQYANAHNSKIDMISAFQR